MSDKAEHDLEDIDGGLVPYTVFSGFCMGSADVVPGVSGGTMAVALGIYHRLLGAITSLDRNALKSLVSFDIKATLARVHWRFIAALGAGILTGIAIMVKVVKLPTMVVASSPHRPLVYAIFFGMVLASAAVIGRHIKGWPPLRIGALVVGAGLGFAIVNLVPTETPNHPLFIFLCGAVAICAMLLPGISGSFILLILNKYAYILGAVAALDLLVILPFIVGCLVGLLSFSRLLKWLLDRWHDTVLATLIACCSAACGASGPIKHWSRGWYATRRGWWARRPISRPPSSPSSSWERSRGSASSSRSKPMRPDAARRTPLPLERHRLRRLSGAAAAA